MQYKLTPEQIREKAKEQAYKLWQSSTSTLGSIEREFISFLEEATGEKIPEPFDEGKVKHGGVFSDSEDRVFVLFDNGGTPNAKDKWSILSIGRFKYVRSPGFMDVTAVSNILRGFHYLGTYDFSAGLPQAIKDL